MIKDLTDISQNTPRGGTQQRRGRSKQTKPPMIHLRDRTTPSDIPQDIPPTDTYTSALLKYAIRY